MENRICIIPYGGVLMKNLFAPLGVLDDVKILRCENDFLKDFFQMLGLSPENSTESIDDAADINQVLDTCISWLYPYYSPLLSHKNANPGYLKILNPSVETNSILNIFHKQFSQAIDKAFVDDLKVLMVCSYRYTNTLYCFSIPNGKSTDESNSEKAQSILNSFLHKNSIKKELDNNARALLHRSSNKNDYERVLSNWRTLNYYKQNNSEHYGRTVCPQFLRRQDSQTKKASLNDSLLDIGISYGLILGHSPVNSPFIRPVKDYKDMPDQDKDNASNVRNEILKSETQAIGIQTDKTKEVKAEKDIFNIEKFINNFVFVNFDEVLYEEGYLEKVLAKYPIKGTPIPKEEFIIIENFIAERIINYNYLAKLFKLHNWLESNYHEAELFLEPLFTELMLLPLPKTRNLIIDSILETFKTYKHTDGKPNSTVYSLPESFANIIEFEEVLFEIVKKWNRLTVTMAVLLFHYVMSIYPVRTEEYFKELYKSKDYSFYKRNRNRITDMDIQIEKKLQESANKKHSESFRRHHEDKIKKGLKLKEIKGGYIKPEERIDDFQAFSSFADNYYKKFNEITLSLDSDHTFEKALINLRMNYSNFIGELFSQLMTETMKFPLSPYTGITYYNAIARHAVKDISNKYQNCADAEEKLKNLFKRFIESLSKNENNQN